jgi:hypothetical protein
MPTAAGDVGGATLSRKGRTASFGCFACASALASASDTGPASGGVSLTIFRCFLTHFLARATHFAFLRFPEVAMIFPFVPVGVF